MSYEGRESGMIDNDKDCSLPRHAFGEIRRALVYGLHAHGEVERIRDFANVEKEKMPSDFPHPAAPGDFALQEFANALLWIDQVMQ